MTTRRKFIACSAVGIASLLVAATATQAQQQQQQTQTKLTSLYVKNMHCEGCAKRLRTRLYKLPNVLKVTTDVKQGIAIITPSTGKDVSTKTVWDAAENEKFNVIKIADRSGTHTKKPLR